MNTPRTVRSREQWQSIIDDFSASSLSAPQYCKLHNLSYASFAGWRKKLLASVAQGKATSGSFLDLSALSMEGDAPGWNITLKLGKGIELVLSQA